MVDIIEKNGVVNIKNSSGGGILLDGQTPITLENIYKTIPIGQEIILYTTEHPVNLYGGGDWEQICECFTFAGSKITYDNNNNVIKNPTPYVADGVVRGELSHDHGLNGTAGAQIVMSGEGALYANINSTVLSYDVKKYCMRVSMSSGSYANSQQTPVVGNTNEEETMPPYQVGYKWKRIG